MTVKEAIRVLTDAKKIYIGWDATINQIDPNDELMMDAFGNYSVKKIVGGATSGEYEIHVAAVPVKEVKSNG